ncbi:hypothetical protein EDD17DRAFT_1560303 [Pisolithus thermaeus]|nr:hypothetical protein EDD17DRAFT_1560303 [Pisolithus thermaeus]
MGRGGGGCRTPMVEVHHIIVEEGLCGDNDNWEDAKHHAGPLRVITMLCVYVMRVHTYICHRALEQRLLSDFSGVCSSLATGRRFYSKKKKSDRCCFTTTPKCRGRFGDWLCSLPPLRTSYTIWFRCCGPRTHGSLLAGKLLRIDDDANTLACWHALVVNRLHPPSEI